MDPTIQRSLKYLKHLVNISSQSNDIAGINKALDKIEEITKVLPLTAKRTKKINFPDFLILKSAYFEKEKPTIVLSGHIDTVLPSSLFKIEEDFIYGSGVKDMKGGIASILSILFVLHKKGLLKNIIVAVSPEEEIATPNYRTTIKKLAKTADYIMVFEFHATQNKSKKFPQNKWNLIEARKGAIVYKIEINGPGGHSGELSQKTERHSTTIPVSEIILALEKIANYKKETTLNTGLVNSGEAINALAKNSTLVGEARFWDITERKRVINEIEKLIQKQKIKYPKLKFEFSIKGEFPPFTTGKNSKLFLKLIQNIGKDMNIEIEAVSQSSSSEANFFSEGNNKSAVIDGFGLWGQDEHRVTEYASLKSLKNSIELGSRIIEALLK